MAEITFGVDDNANINMLGSGLGFYGSTFGSSVSIGSYQDKTYVTNADGTLQGPAANNVKFLDFGSGLPADLGSGILLCNINQNEATLRINFDHTAPVNVQNAQLRIYDRSNINYPATGVLTKVAEVCNMRGVAYATWKATPGGENTPSIGSGDLFWWGAPWDTRYVNQDYFVNSVGATFYNFLSTEVGNGDSRLGAVVGDKETVGGTGIIVPFFDSPGSGGRFLDGIYSTNFRPKWLQYYKSTFRPGSVPNLGANATSGTTGGTGIDMRHTWYANLSASPVSIGSKTMFGLYFSTEYV